MIKLKNILFENLEPYMIGTKNSNRSEVLSYMYDNSKFDKTSGKWKQTSAFNGQFIKFDSPVDVINKLETEYGSGNVVIHGRTNGGDPVVSIWIPNEINQTSSNDGDSNNNGYPDASENPTLANEPITHDNVHKYYNLPPNGYSFASKPLTGPARKLLQSYWYNTASASEKEQEIKQDRADGREWKYMQDNYKWLNTYRNRAITAADKLYRGRFLKKK